MRLYDAIITVAEKAMDLWPNVCEFKPDGSCLRSHNSCCTLEPSCKYLVNGQGCSVKCLACKLWFCPEIACRYPSLVEIMTCLKSRAAVILPRLAFHESREEYEEAVRRMPDDQLVMG